MLRGLTAGPAGDQRGGLYEGCNAPFTETYRKPLMHGGNAGDCDCTWHRKRVHAMPFAKVNEAIDMVRNRIVSTRVVLQH